MDEIEMFTQLRPQPGTLDVSGGRSRLESAITRAPKPPRVSRRIRFAATGALAAAAAATVTAVMLTISSAPPALASVTTALTRTLAQSYSVSEQNRMFYIVNGRIKYPSSSTCTSVSDQMRHLQASSCSWGGIERQVGGYTYDYITDPVGHPGKHWQRTLTGSSAQIAPLNTIALATPQQMLSEIKKADHVTLIGPASGLGWTGTRYAFSGRAGKRIAISGTVDVDRQGLARALALTIRLTSVMNVLVTTQALTFSDFGAPVTVTAPPADQTFTLP